MYREILNYLSQWREKEDKKPLLLVGSKGVGKTWVAKDFGEGFYDICVTLDLKEQDYIKYLFEDDFNEERVIKMLSISCGKRIVPGETLIIVENVDKVKNIEKLLDFFCVRMSKYDVCMTTTCEEEYGINSGYEEKVDIVHIYPLSFSEFLIVNKEAKLCEAIEHNKENPLTENQLRALNDYLKLYYFIGGMPSVVNCWLEEQNLAKVKAEKEHILDMYVEEFKAVEDAPFRNKILNVWESMPAQLLKENKKFQYGVVKATARAREYSDSVAWLISNKYVNKIGRIKEPKAPAAKYEDVKSFELFMVDVGLLSAIYGMEYADIIKCFEKNDEYMIALTEQFAFQELQYNKNIPALWYWISEATARVEFLFEDTGLIIPIEVNLNRNSKAQSIKVFKNKYNPPLTIRITKENFSMNDGLMELPLFSIWNL